MNHPMHNDQPIAGLSKPPHVLSITEAEKTELLRLIGASKNDPHSQTRAWQDYCTLLFGFCKREKVDHNDLHPYMWARSTFQQPNCYNVAIKYLKRHPTTEISSVNHD